MDLELADRQIDPRVARHVCTGAEKDVIDALPQEAGSRLLLRLFSAKESIYKCFAPLLPNVTLRFQDVSISVEHEGVWRAQLETDWSQSWGTGVEFEGKWGVWEEWMWTALWWPSGERLG